MVSPTTESGSGPASRTPASSYVSRTAAQTIACAPASSTPSRSAQDARGGPAQRIRVSSSRGSTPPPGYAYAPPAKAMEARLRSMWTAGPASVSFSRSTVAARLGDTGVRVPSASARMRSGHSGGYH